MKKLLYAAAAAAMVLASCTPKNEPTKTEANDGAIAFGVYTGAMSRAYANPGDPIADASDLALAGGFGVYAYEQGTTAWSTYRAGNTYPNFFYNQNVVSTDAGATWTYAPVKYYSNNEGALHSFFAYAPYSASVKSVFTNEGPAVRYQAATDNYDLLYALPTLNKTKADIHEKIQFNFQHALSKVSFVAETFVDDVHPGSGPHGASAVETGTTVTLRSVKFVGNVPSKGLMSLTTGDWTVEASEESAYEFAPATPVIEFTNTVTGPLPVSSNNLVIPTTGSNKVKVQVVYDVTTIDTENPQNSSTITNTVTSVEEFPLAKGTAYMFHLDLGLTSVKFAADVVDWDADQDKYVDLPNNHKYELITLASLAAAPTVAAVSEVSTLANTGIEYNTTDGCMYNAGTKFSAAAVYVANNKIYTIAADGSVVITTPEAFEVSGTYYLVSAPSSALAPTPVYSLNVNSEGKIQTGANASLPASWVAPTADAYYTFGGNLYQWK